MITSTTLSGSDSNGRPDGIAKVVNDAVMLLRSGRPNMLIIGRDGAIDCALDRLRPHLTAPIADWAPQGAASSPIRTLVVRHVEALTPAEQARLMELSADSVQVISTANAPLFPAVERGAFDDGLYYRLNAVLLNLQAV
jgi:hypothetical protein